MPGKCMFGWYGCEFEIPPELSGLDILADLGIIDDSDETFLNGTVVGCMGRVPNGTAWQSDRLYRIPSNLIQERNYMAMHVWSYWGLGGIIGPPVLKAAITPLNAQWNIMFVNAIASNTGALNKAATLEDALDILSCNGNLEWNKAAMPWKKYASWPGDAHYAVFRSQCDLKTSDGISRQMAKPVVVDMGAVFDVAAFYLNGKRLGLLGRFPEGGFPAFTEASSRGLFVAMPEDWKADGLNEIAAVVYRERGTGGLTGVPGVLLENPLEDSREKNQMGESISFSILIQSGRKDEAARLLERMKCSSDIDESWKLSHLAHLAYLEWFDGNRCNKAGLDKVLEPMASLFKNYQKTSPKQSAMQAFCNVLRLAEKDEELMQLVRKRFPSFGKACKRLAPDRTTLGDWLLFYGNAHVILPALGKTADYSSPLYDTPPYTVATGRKDETARRWQPRSASFVAIVNAHILPPSLNPLEWADTAWLSEYWKTGKLFPKRKMRRAAWWDDHGEMHAFDDEGPDLTVNLERTVKKGQLLSLHLSDFDWRHTPHPRQQSIILTNDSGMLLNAVWSGKSDVGVYERFVFTEDETVRFKVLKHRGACVALSGVFIDNSGIVNQGIPAAHVSEK
ncbi:MAG: hypothetical protein IJS08_12445, partial [Victivallales bacterium]|nr:hypothetical protein [Victivallales bacterium]